MCSNGDIFLLHHSFWCFSPSLPELFSSQSRSVFDASDKRDIPICGQEAGGVTPFNKTGRTVLLPGLLEREPKRRTPKLWWNTSKCLCISAFEMALVGCQKDLESSQGTGVLVSPWGSHGLTQCLHLPPLGCSAMRGLDGTALLDVF